MQTIPPPFKTLCFLGMLILIFFVPAIAATCLETDISKPDSHIVLINDTDHLLTPGTVTHVYGSREANKITLESGAKAKLINFAGSNTITIHSTSNLFTVSRSGAVVTFTGTDCTTLAVPASTVSQTIVFDDGRWNLIIDSSRVMLGNQVVKTVPSGLTPLTHTLSGTITAAGHAATDSDVNDPYADYTPNDTIAQGQALSKPAIVGGYVNKPNAGEQGRSRSSGDENDYYLTSLSAGDTLYLSISDFHNTNADLDLYLYNSATGYLIDASLGIRNFESLTIAEDGNYAIRVFAYAGASNYIFSMGSSSGGSAASDLRLSDPFVPDEIMVSFKSSVMKRISSGTAYGMAQSIGLHYSAGGSNREMLMKLGDANQKRIASQTLGIRQYADSAQGADATIRKKLDTLLTIKALRNRWDIEHADPNYILHSSATPNDPLYQYQWHYPLINLPAAWDITQGNNSVVVAVVDTGVLLDHPDLQPNLTHNGVSGDGFDFIKDPAMARDGDGIDPNPYDQGDLSNGGGSSSFHGTHVAGTVAATGNNNTGVAGVAWKTRIMPIRVLGKGGGTTYDVLQGVRYAAGLPNDSNTTPSRKADIINLSLGGNSYSGTAQAVYSQARNAGIIMIAAAGNDATAEPSYPASYNGVVSVSAVDMNSKIAPYSNYGRNIDVAAPGGDTSQDLNGDGRPDGVLSTLGNIDSGTLSPFYHFYQGTSMAAPHVAGVAALMKAVAPELTPDGFNLSLQRFEIVTDLGENGRDDLYGYGLIDALKAVQAAQGFVGTETTLQIQPQMLNLGWCVNSVTLTASKKGTEPLGITSVTNNAPWMSVTELSVDNNGLGSYTITVDRSDLANGSYRADITFFSTENTLIIPVNMQVNNSPLPADAGYHYVLLLDADSMNLVQQKNTMSVNGNYDYTFTDVPGNATYKICAGTDFDNDSFIGDAGESFGMYKTVDQPVGFTVDEDMTRLDFTTEYMMNIPGTSQSETNPSFLYHLRPIKRLPESEANAGINVKHPLFR